jgi:hypothetical protein
MALMSSLNTWQIKRQLKEEVLRSVPLRAGESRAAVDLDSIMTLSGMEIKLKNSIYQIFRQAKSDVPAVPEGTPAALGYSADRLEYVEKAKLKWERRIRLELDAMAAEMGVPLQRGKVDESSNRLADQADQAIRFVYDDNDLLDVLSSITNPNRSVSFSKIPSMCLIKVELAILDIAQLRATYKELDPTRRRAWNNTEDDGERIKLFQRVVDQGFIPELRQHAKRGVPQAMRPKVWQKILGVEVSESDRAYFHNILESLKEWELVTDELFRLDVSLMASDDHYFVFEDILADIMAVFSRDPWLCQHAAVRSQANDKDYSDEARQHLVFPPCGIVPFRGIGMYAAPLCYLYSDAPQLYLVFRAIYSNYCCRLNTVSSSEGGILHLARQFECALQEACPELLFHLVRIGAPPLKLVFSWLFFAFAGVLEVEQVLALWDLVLAWDSLLVVPVLAAALLAFREKRLREAATIEEAHDALADCSHIRVIPVLQLFLFRGVVARLEQL